MLADLIAPMTGRIADIGFATIAGANASVFLQAAQLQSIARLGTE